MQSWKNDSYMGHNRDKSNVDKLSNIRTINDLKVQQTLFRILPESIFFRRLMAMLLERGVEGKR